MEWVLLQALHWRLHVPNTYSFLSHFLLCLPHAAPAPAAGPPPKTAAAAGGADADACHEMPAPAAAQPTRAPGVAQWLPVTSRAVMLAVSVPFRLRLRAALHVTTPDAALCALHARATDCAFGCRLLWHPAAPASQPPVPLHQKVVPLQSYSTHLPHYFLYLFVIFEELFRKFLAIHRRCHC